MTTRRRAIHELVTSATVALGLLICAVPREARADAVDDAFVRGNAAAQAGDWQGAVEAYREAWGLLPHQSAMLSYNLGTAYAHLGDLGQATYHLHRATEFDEGTTAEILEAARYNLEVVRGRVEIAAAANGTVVDSPETWWDVIVALKAPALAWLSLISGWLLLGCVALHRLRPRRERPLMWALMIMLALLFVIPGALHGLALRAERTAPEGVVFGERVDAREGPGMHRSVAFTLQGGARVRIMDRAPGWQEVRLPGGLSGWVREDAVARLGGPSRSYGQSPLRKMGGDASPTAPRKGAQSAGPRASDDDAQKVPTPEAVRAAKAG